MKYKMAYLWCGMNERDGKPFADLYFSSSHKFLELVGESVANNKTTVLGPVCVPSDFEDWDYVPDNY